MLICEDVNFTRAGLILPLHKKDAFALIHQPEDLPEVGESLVGWLGQSRSFYTFLTAAPSFEYPRDFRILPLQAIEEGALKEDKPKDNTLLVVPRMEADTRPISLTEPVVETIRRLLSPLYDEVPDWHFYLGQGRRDLLDPLIDFNSSANLSDAILNGLANMVISLGGKTTEGQNLWRFCCILLPNNPSLPMQQQRLVVRAQSKKSPHILSVTYVSPEDPIISLSVRAFQSSHVIYRPNVSIEDTAIAYRNAEGSIHSAIAVPVGGEERLPIAVLYIISNEANAFSEDDQRLLRIFGRMIEELIMTYYARMQVTKRLNNLIITPSIVDTSFKNFLSENEFIRDVETLLNNLKIRIDEREERPDSERISLSDLKARSESEQLSKEVVSFIAIDLDNQTRYANKYGDQMAKNLSRTLGLRILEQLPVLFTKDKEYRLYHIYADRYYLLLNGIPLEQAREKAERLRQALNGSYRVDAVRTSIEQPTLPDSMVELLDLTVRLGVTSYEYKKLHKVLQRYPAVTAVADVRASILHFLDVSLNMGKKEGGNIIVAWNPEIWGLAPWQPKSLVQLRGNNAGA